MLNSNTDEIPPAPMPKPKPKAPSTKPGPDSANSEALELYGPRLAQLKLKKTSVMNSRTPSLLA